VACGPWASGSISLATHACAGPSHGDTSPTRFSFLPSFFLLLPLPVLFLFCSLLGLNLVSFYKYLLTTYCVPDSRH
jgi:hypothetical protein